MYSVERLAFDDTLSFLIGELEKLYGEMDRRYMEAAEHYGFDCSGCTDNCCLSRFYHHTYLEYIYLRRGFLQLSQDRRAEILGRARQYVRALDRREASRDESFFRVMCPLNESGLCVLYQYRPMICRLHGLPHELSPPGRQKMIFSQGCHKFSEECGHLTYFPLDRTAFYLTMSELEREFKKTAGISGKSRKTVAHMLICDEVNSL